MSTPIISMIAIISKNRGLGKDNKLLFHIPGELPRFKKITTGHPVIMGRKTFESIGKPLPNRLNIVVSKNISNDQKNKYPGVLFFINLQSAISLAKEEELKRIQRDSSTLSQNDPGEIFIIGGGQIYKQAMPFADRLDLTVVDKEVDADTFFPDYSGFTKVIDKEEHEDAGYKYTFLTLEK